MNTRVDLAWCLLLQAINRAGQEDNISLHTAAGTRSTSDDPKDNKRERDASTLLRECMRQLHTVAQLSPEMQERMDFKQLQQLVKLSGNAEIIAQSEAEAVGILARLTREIMQQPSDPQR